MKKNLVTVEHIRKLGVRRVMQDLELALIGHAYDWRCAGSPDREALTDKLIKDLKDLREKYLEDVVNA